MSYKKGSKTVLQPRRPAELKIVLHSSRRRPNPTVTFQLASDVLARLDSCAKDASTWYGFTRPMNRTQKLTEAVMGWLAANEKKPKRAAKKK